jgi:hypothetical protein
MGEAFPSAATKLRQSAVRFIVLLGVVSLFADMTYEGARSVTGPYLGVLGASAAAVGIVAGFGEFLGYALRFLGLSYRSHRQLLGNHHHRLRDHSPFRAASCADEALGACGPADRA